MKKHIPNIITLLNLFFGCCALAGVFYGEYVIAFWFTFAGVMADYFDGLIARALNVHSELGKELDSIADMATFGVLPGAILYVLLAEGVDPARLPSGIVWAALPAFAVSVFSGLRLALFNIDTRQTHNFLGLPTPSCTTFVVGLLLIYHYDSFGLRPLVANWWFLYGCTAALCYLLVSEFPMFSLKLKSFTWKGNEIKFIFAALCVVLLIVVQEAAFSFSILLYVLMSATDFLLKRNRTT